MTEHEADYAREREAEARAGEREGERAKAQHTPGPWRHDTTWNLILGPNNEEIAAVHPAQGPGKRVKPEIALANARLIAAAPELYDACRLAVVSMKDPLDGNSPGWMDDMRADLDFIEKAIAKAR